MEESMTIENIRGMIDGYIARLNEAIIQHSPRSSFSYYSTWDWDFIDAKLAGKDPWAVEVL